MSVNLDAIDMESACRVCLLYLTLLRTSYICVLLVACRQLSHFKFFIMAIGLTSGLSLSLLPYSTYLNMASGQMADIYRNEGDDRVRYDPNDPEYYNNLTKFSYIL